MDRSPPPDSHSGGGGGGDDDDDWWGGARGPACERAGGEYVVLRGVGFVGAVLQRGIQLPAVPALLPDPDAGGVRDDDGRRGRRHEPEHLREGTHVVPLVD